MKLARIEAAEQTAAGLVVRVLIPDPRDESGPFYGTHKLCATVGAKVVIELDPDLSLDIIDLEIGKHGEIERRVKAQNEAYIRHEKDELIRVLSAHDIHVGTANFYPWIALDQVLGTATRCNQRVTRALQEAVDRLGIIQKMTSDEATMRLASEGLHAAEDVDIAPDARKLVTYGITVTEVPRAEPGDRA